jgi:hypothetical protein
MTNPSWRVIARKKIAARPEGLWNVALDYVSGPRLLRLTVLDRDERGAVMAKSWNPTSKEESGPDGLLKTSAKSGLLFAMAPYGALIGKVGGSSADQPETGGGAKDGGYSGRKVFAAGSYAVIGLGKDDGGPLFLTMNDSPDGFAEHAGALEVLIEEAAL